MSTVVSMLPWAALSLPAIIVIAYGVIQYRRASYETFLLECELGFPAALSSSETQLEVDNQTSDPGDASRAIFRSVRSVPPPRPISRSQAVRMHRQHRVKTRVRSRPSGFAV